MAALFTLVQLPYAPGNFYPDSTEYLTQVYGMVGDSPAEGRDKAIRAFCDQYRNKSLVLDPVGYKPKAGAKAAKNCVKRLHAQDAQGPGTRYGPAITRGASIPSTRYEDIFLSRRGVAVLYLPGVVILGPRAGMWLTALFWTLLGGVLVFLLLRRLGTSPGVAVLGQVLYLILPMRKWTMAPLSEGITLGLLMTCLLGAVYLLTGDRKRGLWLLAAGFGVGLFVKYSQFLLFAAAMAGILAIVWLVQRRRAEAPAPGLTLTLGAAVAAAAAMFLFSKLFGWPGTADTMQDLLTEHFRQPDVADPFGGWLNTNIDFWRIWLAEQLQEPFLLVAWAAGAWGVFRFHRPAGYVLLATLLAGLANQVGHPNVSQGDRIYTAAWLLTVYGVPLLVHTFRKPEPPATEPVTQLIPIQARRSPDSVPTTAPVA
ncbi:hypothetical protein [Actinoplanes awajinensis]|uniref:Glycosyltransferase RgtA/B/C/D-like domain-containing protein n=1 Tax=Actinoplanes awajinensis subsp. mycoplanecinus TaxID=135947 RepID=A0A117MR88_9ACTN|nr:hypothetical protein [Actinoplanes awajinensis]KUL31466.1 hypothetical protein ADL15_22295 [Actinoplanes awajinensis subsp. mycoplanecinus]